MELGHIQVYGIKTIKVGEKAVWRKIRERWVKYVGEEAKDGKSELEMHDYLAGMYYATKPHNYPVKEFFKNLNKYEIGIHGDTIHVKRKGEKEKTHGSKNNVHHKEVKVWAMVTKQEGCDKQCDRCLDNYTCPESGK